MTPPTFLFLKEQVEHHKNTLLTPCVFFTSPFLSFFCIVLHGCKISLPGGFSVLRATYAADPGPLEKDRLLGDMLYSAISRQADPNGVPSIDGYSDSVSTSGSLMDRSDTGDSLRTLEHPNARLSGTGSVATDHASRSSTQSTALSTSEADENFYNLPPYAQFQLRQQRAAAVAENSTTIGTNGTPSSLTPTQTQQQPLGTSSQAGSLGPMRDFQSQDSSSGGSSPSSLQQQQPFNLMKRSPPFDVTDSGILPPSGSIDGMQGDLSQRTGGQWGNPRGLSNQAFLGPSATDMNFFQQQQQQQQLRGLPPGHTMPPYPGMSQPGRPKGFPQNQGIPPNTLPLKMHQQQQQQAFDNQLYQHHLMQQQQYQRQTMGHDMRMQQQQQQRFGGYPGYPPGFAGGSTSVPQESYVDYNTGILPQDPASAYMRAQPPMPPNSFPTGPLGKPYDPRNDSAYQNRGGMPGPGGPLPMMRRFPDGVPNPYTMRDGTGYYSGPSMPHLSSLGEPSFPGDDRSHLASLGKDTAIALGDIGSIGFLPGQNQGSTSSGKSWSDYSGNSQLVGSTQGGGGSVGRSDQAGSSGDSNAASNPSSSDDRANEGSAPFFSTANKDASSTDDTTRSAPSTGLGLSAASSSWTSTGQELSSPSTGASFQQQQQQQQNDPDSLGLASLSIDGSASFSWPSSSS